MKKFKCICLALIIVISCLTGCEKEPVQPKIEVPIVLIDQLDRKVTLSENPKRIISTYYSCSSLLIALGMKDVVVGIENGANSREIYIEAAPNYLKLPSISTDKKIDVEACVKLNPDLVILSSKMKKAVKEFEMLDIPVIVADSNSYADFLDTISMVSKATGSDTKGEVLIARYERIINDAPSVIEDIYKPSIYFASDDSVYKTCTETMYQHTLIEAAGGKNVAENIEDPSWATVTAREIKAWNPDVILTTRRAVYSDDDIFGVKRIKSISAIKNKRLFRLPNVLEPWDCLTPSSMLGVLWLRSKLFPKTFPFEDFLSTTQSFYKTFYDIDVSTKNFK